MIYDSLKVLKKVIKYWWIYLITIALAVCVYFLPFANTLHFVNKQIYSIECFSSDAADFEYYKFAQDKAMLDLEQNFGIIEKGVKEEDSTIKEISVEINSYNTISVKIVGSTKLGVESAVNIIKNKIEVYLEDTMLVKTGYDQSKKISPVIESFQISEISTESNNSDITSKILIIGVVIVLMEVFVFAILGCYDNKLYFKGELKDKFNKSVLVDNCNNENEKLLKIQLKKLDQKHKNVVYVGCNVSLSKEIGNLLDFKQNDTKVKIIDADCVVVNVECGKSSCKEIEEIIDFCEAQNIKSIYFVLLKSMNSKKG